MLHNIKLIYLPWDQNNSRAGSFQALESQCSSETPGPRYQAEKLYFTQLENSEFHLSLHTLRKLLSAWIMGRMRFFNSIIVPRTWTSIWEICLQIYSEDCDWPASFISHEHRLRTIWIPPTVSQNHARAKDFVGDFLGFGRHNPVVISFFNWLDEHHDYLCQNTSFTEERDYEKIPV